MTLWYINSHPTPGGGEGGGTRKSLIQKVLGPGAVKIRVGRGKGLGYIFLGALRSFCFHQREWNRPAVEITASILMKSKIGGLPGTAMDSNDKVCGPFLRVSAVSAFGVSDPGFSLPPKQEEGGGMYRLHPV